MPSTDIVNVSLSWEGVAGTPIDIDVFGTNVTDEEYLAFVPGLAAGTGFETAVLGHALVEGLFAGVAWQSARPRLRPTAELTLPRVRPTVRRRPRPWCRP